MKILLVVWSLTQQKGGRERAGVALANAMHQRGHQCIVLTDDHRRRPPLYELEPGVRLLYMDLFDNSYSRLQLRKLLVNESPDVIMTMCSSREIIDWPVLLKGTGIPLILSERVDPFVTERDCWVGREERLSVFAAADLIHIQMGGYKSYYPEFMQDRVVTIPNPVASAAHLADPAGVSRERKLLINVGRISEKQKKQILLAQAFALVASEFPDWDLQYWGGGAVSSGQALDNAINSLGLRGRAHVCWVTDNVGEKLAAAQVFAFPSEMEGCPNALLEAQAHGLPALGYRQCGGTNEIIEHGVNGLLFDALTPESIAEGLRQLLADADTRVRMGKAALENSRRFLPEAIFARYEEMFRAAAARKGATRFDSLPESPLEAEVRARIEYLCTREKVHKQRSRPIIPLPLAAAETLRKRFSRAYIRPIRDALRRFRKADKKKKVGPLPGECPN